MMNSVGPWLILTLFCQPVPAQDAPASHHYFLKEKHESLARWGYSGPVGPQFWGELSPSYKLASTGKHQSPIDINTSRSPLKNLPGLKFDYRRERIAAVNNGHTIQHSDVPGSFLHVGDDKYSLEQFHVHTPSEHTIDGQRYDMEIHFVHKSEAGNVVVVGVLVKADEKADLDFPLYYEIPTVPGEAVSFSGTRNPSDYLPRGREYFMYSGSYTTPPCTENIQWIVLRDPLRVPPKLIERFVAILKYNNRPVQQLNDRTVMRSR